jgi:hypothetical protein
VHLCRIQVTRNAVIGLVLGSCLLMALASPVKAAAPTVTGVSPSSGGTGTVPVVITGNNFADNATTVEVSGSGVTVSAVAVDSPTSIRATFTIAADATPTARDVSVTVAGDKGTGVGLFTVSAYITVVAPTAINLGYMTAGQTNTATAVAGTVTSNYITTWQVSAVDAKPTARGYMNTQADGSGTSLGARFQMSMTAGNYTDADSALTYPGKPASLPLFISQAVAADDSPGSYRITITFTGSGS